MKTKRVSGDAERVFESHGTTSGAVYEKMPCNCQMCKCDSCGGLAMAKGVPEEGKHAPGLRWICQVCQCDPLKSTEVSKASSKAEERARARLASTAVIDEAKTKDIELTCQICQCASCCGPAESKRISKDVEDIFKADQVKYNLASSKSEEVTREDYVGRFGAGTIDTSRIRDYNSRVCRESYEDRDADFNETCRSCTILKSRASKCDCCECVFKREQDESGSVPNKELPEPNTQVSSSARASLGESKRTQRACIESSSSEVKKQQCPCTPCSSKPFETVKNLERAQKPKLNVSGFVQCVLSKIRSGKSKEEVEQSKRELSSSSHECAKCKERRKAEDEAAVTKETVDLKSLSKQLTNVHKRREQLKVIALPKADKTVSQMKLLLMMLRNKGRNDDEKIGDMFRELRTKTDCKNYGDVLKKIALQVPAKVFHSALKLCVKISRPVELKPSSEGRCACDGVSVEVVKILKIAPDAFLAKWIAPKDKSVVGYEIYVDDVLKSCVYNGKRTSAVVFGVKLVCETHVTVLALTANAKY